MSGVKKKLLKNFFSLSMLQGLNYLIPIITMPYLFRTLGPYYFGVLAIATAAINYLVVITDYGFNFIATKDISVNRENKEKLIEIYSSVLTIKLLLCLLCFFFLLLILFISKQDYFFIQVYVFTYGIVLGQSLFSTWFFQGVEEMKYITLINVVFKLSATLFIFIIVRSKDDVLFVPIISSLGYILSGLASFFIIQRKYLISFQPQTLMTIKVYFSKNWNMFISNFFTLLYRNSNVLILGFFSSASIVASYAIAEKIIKAIQSIQMIFGTACYPYLAKKFNNDHSSFYEISKKYWLIILLAYFLLTLIVYFLSPVAIYYSTGYNDFMAIQLMKIMSFLILFGGLNYTLGVLGLIPMGYSKYFSNSVVITGIFSITLSALLSKYYGGYGASISIVLCEVLLLVALSLKIKSLYLSRGRK
ncbi:TPA: O158 family O-antigen flippase [Escherichia coli]|nr:O158 family O-antigen flippase [Escherichia coli]